MRWIIKENEESPCPGLEFCDLPDIIPENLSISVCKGIINILGKSIAGVIPCKNGNELIIKSKYDLIHPLELVLYINGIAGITVAQEEIGSGNEQIDLHTLADKFVEQLRIIQSETKKFKRKASLIQTNAVIGKVEWLRTYRAQQNHKVNSVITKINTPSYDIPENALIAAAAKKIADFYAVDSEVHRILLPWIELATRFRHNYSELYLMQRKLSERSFSGAHAFYYVPVMIAKIILGFQNDEMLSRETDAILFNMPGLYEEYIRMGFRRVASKYGCSIRKGLSPRSFLFFDGECEMIPDITVYEGADIKAILDVKNKKPDSKDYYQVFAYMKYAHINTAYIVSPDVENEKTIVAFDGGKVIHIRIDNSKTVYLESVVEQIIRSIM